MEAAGRGARDSSCRSHGKSVGILPGHDACAANPYVDVAILPEPRRLSQRDRYPRRQLPREGDLGQRACTLPTATASAQADRRSPRERWMVEWLA